MDAVTLDLLYTSIICLSLLLLSMIALRVLPESPMQIRNDVAAWGRIARQIRSAAVPTIAERMEEEQALVRYWPQIGRVHV